MTQVFIDLGGSIVDAEDFEAPLDRVFRDAWALTGAPDAQVIEIDMDKARGIWRDKIRAARVDRFVELDAEFMRALEVNGDVTEIVQKKQALRDAPSDPAIDAAETPDELKLVQPAGLVVEL